MAPRRLIIVMLVLLAFSTALALLVPEPQPPDSNNGPNGTAADRSQPAPTREPTESGGDSEGKSRPGPTRKETPRPGARTVEATVRAGGPVERITIERGDRLVVAVRSGEPTTVAIEGAGLVEVAGPYAPARFDLLARDSTERLSIVDLESGRQLARIEID